MFTMAQTYLRVILLFSPAFLMNNVLLCFVRNDGAPQLSMAAMIGGSLSNVVLDWVFIFPCGMGIFGAVFATGPVSYTHLDVYKRQLQACGDKETIGKMMDAFNNVEGVTAKLLDLN